MYGTIADWRAYALARGDSAPTDASDADATAALVRASDYIKYSYVARFTSACDDTSDNVELATYEAANLELATVGFFSKTFTPDQQKLLTQVDTIQWTPVVGAGAMSAGQAAMPRSTIIDAMLAECMPNEVNTLAPYIKTIGAQE